MAHYHNPEADVLLDAVLDLLTHRPDVRVILVPRNEKQAHTLRMQWGRWIANRKIITPEHVVNGLNLIWFSDFVIRGGGTGPGHTGAQVLGTRPKRNRQIWFLS